MMDSSWQPLRAVSRLDPSQGQVGRGETLSVKGRGALRLGKPGSGRQPLSWMHSPESSPGMHTTALTTKPSKPRRPLTARSRSRAASHTGDGPGRGRVARRQVTSRPRTADPQQRATTRLGSPRVSYPRVTCVPGDSTLSSDDREQQIQKHVSRIRGARGSPRAAISSTTPNTRSVGGSGGDPFEIESARRGKQSRPGAGVAATTETRRLVPARPPRPSTARARLVGGYGVEGDVRLSKSPPRGIGVVMAAVDAEMPEPADWHVAITEAALRETDGERSPAGVIANWAAEIRPLRLLRPCGIRTAEYFCQLAFRERARGNFDGAIQLYGKALRLDPRCFLARFNQGYVWLRKGNPRKARADFFGAIEINSSSGFAHHNVAVCSLLLGEPSTAIVHSTQALAQRPILPLFLQTRAHAFRLSGQLDNAIRDYIDLRRVAPTTSSLYSDTASPDGQPAPHPLHGSPETAENTSLQSSATPLKVNTSFEIDIETAVQSPSDLERATEVIPAEEVDAKTRPVEEIVEEELALASVPGGGVADEAAAGLCSQEGGSSVQTDVRSALAANTFKCGASSSQQWSPRYLLSLPVPPEARESRDEWWDPEDIDADPDHFHQDGPLFYPFEFRPLATMKTTEELRKQCTATMTKQPRDRQAQDLRFLELLTRHTNFFSSLSRAAHLRLCRVMGFQEAHAKDVICAQRERFDYFCVIVAGSVSVFRNQLPTSIGGVANASLAVVKARNQLEELGMKSHKRREMATDRAAGLPAQSAAAAMAASRTLEGEHARDVAEAVAATEVATTALRESAVTDLSDENALGAHIGHLYVGDSFNRICLNQDVSEPRSDVTVIADEYTAFISIHKDDYHAEMAANAAYQAREIIRFLLKCSIFSNCPRNEIASLVDDILEERLLSGKTLIQQGYPLKGMYILRHGRATVSRLVHDDRSGHPRAGRDGRERPGKRSMSEQARPEDDRSGTTDCADFEVSNPVELGVSSPEIGSGSPGYRDLRPTPVALDEQPSLAAPPPPRTPRSAGAALRRASLTGAVDIAGSVPSPVLSPRKQSQASEDSVRVRESRVRDLRLGSLGPGDYYAAEEAVLDWAGAPADPEVPMYTADLVERANGAKVLAGVTGEWRLQDSVGEVSEIGSGLTYHVASHDDIAPPQHSIPSIRLRDVVRAHRLSECTVTTDTNVEVLVISKAAIYKHLSFATRQKMRENVRCGRATRTVKTTEEEIRWEREKERIVRENVRVRQVGPQGGSRRSFKF